MHSSPKRATLSRMEHDMTRPLEVRELTIVYGEQTAVENLSFFVEAGEIFGLLGPNGAGKTSTLSAVEGLLKPRHGTIVVVGFDIYKDPLEARANLGVQLQSTSFQQNLTVAEIVTLYGGLYGIALSKADVEKVLSDIQLQNDGGKQALQLSGGQQQRLALSVATLHDPPLVLLDEPTTGLDPQSRRQLWERIERMKKAGRSVLLTTHSMEEAQAICDRVAIMDHGRIIAVDNPGALVEKHKDDPDVRAVMRLPYPTLEDVFIGLTGRAVRR